jgi:HAD superfamily hydrolase (TIGR01509 family)
MDPQNRDLALLFDLDGTLVDTAYEHVLAWSAALRSTDLAVPKWKIHRRIGMSGRALVRQVVRELGRRHGKVNIDALEKKHDAAFNKIASVIWPLPGARDLLEHLTRVRVPWAVATTGGREQTLRLLRSLRIPAQTIVVTGDDVTKAKPAPDVFVMAAQRLNIPIEHCIVVGDSIWDILAAGRRRALAVGVLSGGYSQEELEQSGAFRVYADPADLLEHIEDLGIG